MSEKKKQALKLSDAESVYDAILSLIKQFPDYPKSFKAGNDTIKWNTTIDGTCIGLFTLSGAAYLKKYVSGSYVAEMPFEIAFKTAYTTNKSGIDAQRLVTAIGSWLENCEIDFEDEHLSLESIERTTPAFIAMQDEQYTMLAVDMKLTYRYIK